MENKPDRKYPGITVKHIFGLQRSGDPGDAGIRGEPGIFYDTGHINTEYNDSKECIKGRNNQLQ